MRRALSDAPDHKAVSRDPSASDQADAFVSAMKRAKNESAKRRVEFDVVGDPQASDVKQAILHEEIRRIEASIGMTISLSLSRALELMGNIPGGATGATTLAALLSMGYTVCKDIAPMTFANESVMPTEAEVGAMLGHLAMGDESIVELADVFFEHLDLYYEYPSIASDEPCKEAPNEASDLVPVPPLPAPLPTPDTVQPLERSKSSETPSRDKVPRPERAQTSVRFQALSISTGAPDSDPLIAVLTQFLTKETNVPLTALTFIVDLCTLLRDLVSAVRERPGTPLTALKDALVDDPPRLISLASSMIAYFYAVRMVPGEAYEDYLLTPMYQSWYAGFGLPIADEESRDWFMNNVPSDMVLDAMLKASGRTTGDVNFAVRGLLLEKIKGVKQELTYTVLWERAKEKQYERFCGPYDNLSEWFNKVRGNQKWYADAARARMIFAWLAFVFLVARGRHRVYWPDVLKPPLTDDAANRMRPIIRQQLQAIQDIPVPGLPRVDANLLTDLVDQMRQLLGDKSQVRMVERDARALLNIKEDAQKRMTLPPAGTDARRQLDEMRNRLF